MCFIINNIIIIINIVVFFIKKNIRLNIWVLYNIYVPNVDQWRKQDFRKEGGPNKVNINLVTKKPF